jgi:hypothetical protein
MLALPPQTSAELSTPPTPTLTTARRRRSSLSHASRAAACAAPCAWGHPTYNIMLQKDLSSSSHVQWYVFWVRQQGR